ncbi:hypothetical protein OUZ56_021355 [Daphnia magna]|uniref:Uncharacterized protein n=1 Tax=Daphnia magna TaxID=35525 RepID=A0ABQ9ZH48_9CRUS|nr:hypothetical protein OUZ56_021355 [Daphnia magna]
METLGGGHRLPQHWSTPTDTEAVTEPLTASVDGIAQSRENKKKEGSDYGRMDVLGTKRTGGQLPLNNTVHKTDQSAPNCLEDPIGSAAARLLIVR